MLNKNVIKYFMGWKNYLIEKTDSFEPKNIVFWGPAGTGKSTLAKLMA